MPGKQDLSRTSSDETSPHELSPDNCEYGGDDDYSSDDREMQYSNNDQSGGYKDRTDKKLKRQDVTPELQDLFAQCHKRKMVFEPQIECLFGATSDSTFCLQLRNSLLEKGKKEAEELAFHLQEQLVQSQREVAFYRDQVQQLQCKNMIEQWNKCHHDLLINARVANDFRKEAQQNIDRLTCENRSFKQKNFVLEEEIKSLRARLELQYLNFAQTNLRFANADANDWKNLEKDPCTTCWKSESTERASPNMVAEINTHKHIANADSFLQQMELKCHQHLEDKTHLEYIVCELQKVMEETILQLFYMKKENEELKKKYDEEILKRFLCFLSRKKQSCLYLSIFHKCFDSNHFIFSKTILIIYLIFFSNDSGTHFYIVIVMHVVTLTSFL